ncbi:MAG: proteasome accessory factor PafA2 family protein [Bifidobacteriaceae bacterium]|jgi:proteasome accessory factor A|nr:proteasome accessory factor PafA2 family protein [Bifidobacteriaceae bacterium]
MPQLRDSSNEASAGSHLNRHANDFSRIFGIETEYGVSITQTRRRLDPSRAAMVMFEPVVNRQRSTNTYLANGSRLYLDVGSHPEYATAEAATPAAAVAQDAGGELVMKRLANAAQARLAEQLGEPNLKLHLYKNNLDAEGNSFGCHENYLLRRTVPLKVVERVLIPFLATRLIWAGAGHVGGASGEGATGDGTAVSFEIAQRAEVLDEAVSSATTRVRPMINTRDEPHADPDQFRRLHVIVGDSNRSQTSTWLRLATTHLVLCMIEEALRGGKSEGFSVQLAAMLEAVPRSVRDNSTSVMKAVSAGSAGAVRDALMTQRLYCDAASLFARQHREELVGAGSIGESELDEALRLWDGAIAAGEYALTVQANAGVGRAGEEGHGSPSDSVTDLVADEMPDWAEWAAKYRLLKAFRQRHPEATVERLEQIELAYHDVAASSVFESLVKRGSMPERVSVRESRRAMDEPPMGTRAMLRGEFVRKALKSRAEWSCDWTHLEVKIGGGSAAGVDSGGSRRYEVVLLDPFDDSMTPHVREVFDALDE